MPDAMRADAARIDKLSTPALQNLAAVLHPCLMQPMSSTLAEELSRFCLRFEIAEADLGHVIKVCRWLLHEASAMNLSGDELEADALSVWPDHEALAQTLRAEYEPLKATLRQQFLMDALTHHGNVLVDVDWRVDQLSGDRRAAKLDMPIAIVTLAYRSHDRDERLTLQMTPDHLGRLAQVFSALAQRTKLTGR